MRNLKRVLSLALAVVMVIGMMVMTTGTADLNDYDEISYVEAVDVMSALGILEGDENSNFNPTDILTREQAAKIICYMLMGPANAELLNGTAYAFDDVEADRWSAPFISYCSSLGIIAGYDGYFDPAGELIYAAGKPAPTNLMLILKNHTYTNNVFTSTQESQVLFVDKDATTSVVKIASIDGAPANTTNLTTNNTYSIDADTDPYTVNYTYNGNDTSAVRLFAYEESKMGYVLESKTTSVATLSKIETNLPTYWNANYGDTTGNWSPNSDTVYLVRDTKVYNGADAINQYKDTFTAYTGYENVPTITNAKVMVYAVRGVAKYVVVVGYDTISNTATDLFYATSGDMTAVYKNDNSGNVNFWYVTGIYNGEKTTLKLNSNAASTLSAAGANKLAAKKLFMVTKYDADGYVDTIAAVSGNQYYLGMIGTDAAKANVVVMNTASTDVSFSYTNETVVYTINGNVLTVGGIGTITEDPNDTVTVVTAGAILGTAENRQAKAIYIWKNAPTATSYTLSMVGTNGFAYTVNADATVKTTVADTETESVKASDVVTLAGHTTGGTVYTITGVTVSSGACNLVNNGNGTWTVTNVTAHTNLNVSVTASAVPVVSISGYTVTITPNGAAPTAIANEIVAQLMGLGYARNEIALTYNGSTFALTTTQNGLTITWTVI